LQLPLTKFELTVIFRFPVIQERTGQSDVETDEMGRRSAMRNAAS